MIRTPRFAMVTTLAAAILGRLSSTPNRIVTLADRVAPPLSIETMATPTRPTKRRDTRPCRKIAGRRTKAKAGQRTRLANARNARR